MRDSTKKNQIQIFISQEDQFDKKTIDVTVGQPLSLLEILNINKVEVSQSCGGSGSCGTCQVKVISGLENLSERNEIEKEIAEDRKFPSDIRLSCQTEVFGPCHLLVPTVK